MVVLSLDLDLELEWEVREDRIQVQTGLAIWCMKDARGGRVWNMGGWGFPFL